MALSEVAEPLRFLRFTWEAPPASEPPKGATKEVRKLYFKNREIANAAHKISLSWCIHHKLVRNEEDDPAQGLNTCKEYLLVKQKADPEWLTKNLTALLYANKALTCTSWSQYYLDSKKYNQVCQDLALCAETAGSGSYSWWSFTKKLLFAQNC
jgi:hypothetical protein